LIILHIQVKQVELLRARPDIWEFVAEEDGRHGVGLGMRGEVEEMGELEGEGVCVGLLVEVEEGWLVVGGGHEISTAFAQVVSY
jgi:hypothetical protein